MAWLRKGSGRAATFDALQPDPDKVGGVAEAPFVRLADPATTFSNRARRLGMVAQGHPLQAYLLFLRQITEAQHLAQGVLPPPSSLDREQLAQRLRNAMPPLSRDLLCEDLNFNDTMDWLLANVRHEDAPAAAREARDRLAALSHAERLPLALDVFEATYRTDWLGESLYVAAAVQVYLTRQAALLDAAALQAVADGVCPVCGGAPVASLVVGWTQATKARYLCCSLCSTLWNYVRIKCTACSSTEGISYYAVEGGSENVASEICRTCRSYLKHLHQHRDPQIEPCADAVASYGLDLMIREEDFRPGGINPLFVTG